MNQIKNINAILQFLNRIAKSKTNTRLVIVIIFLTAFLSDQYLVNSAILIPLCFSSLISIAFTYFAIPRLKAFKLRQTIRKEGPQKHLDKQGTPTLGGIIIIPIGITVGLIANISKIDLNQLLSVSFITFIYMLIGTIDDYLSIINKRNMGLSPKGKLVLQILSGIIFISWANKYNLISTNINLWFDITINFYHLIWPLALFVLVAESNATNLTDGLDGLAAGCGGLIFTGFSLHLILQNNDLDIALSKFCISMAGVLIGFLLLNKNPAKIFMGDSGSLAIGASLAGIALISNNLWTLLIMGGIFLIEAISVIIQVIGFKLTKNLTGSGKRVFLMAPIHHHFELKGEKEHIIVRNFWLITLGFISLSFLFK